VIVLDTNVVLELMKSAPDAMVARWVADRQAATMYTTSITQAEVLHGILMLPAGKRRAALQAAAEAMFEKDFGGRVLPFGGDAARAYAQIAAHRRRSGRPISTFDAQIAAITRVARATVATRNVGDYDDCGVKVLNPWDSRGA
jgi:predicted nucleic acid-binding protein